MKEPSYQDVWKLLKQSDRVVVRVSKDYAPTLRNGVKCAKWVDNSARKAAGLAPYPKHTIHVTECDADALYVIMTFEFPFSLRFL